MIITPQLSIIKLVMPTVSLGRKNRLGLLERIVSVMLQSAVHGICNIKDIITALTWLGVISGALALALLVVLFRSAPSKFIKSVC